MGALSVPRGVDPDGSQRLDPRGDDQRWSARCACAASRARPQAIRRPRRNGGLPLPGTHCDGDQALISPSDPDDSLELDQNPLRACRMQSAAPSLLMPPLIGKSDWETIGASVTTRPARGEGRVDIPVLEQARIQAQVLVPLIKALQAELGEERANALVRRALGDLYRRLGEQWWQRRDSRHLGENMASA